MAKSLNLLNLELNIHENMYNRNFYYNQLKNICMNRFIWNDLPNKIDREFLEKMLCENGEIAFLNHPLYGYVVCQCIGDDLNLYDRYTKYFCFTNNGLINDYFKEEDLVIIRNNPLSEPCFNFILKYSERLGEYTSIKEVNMNAIKTPIIVQCTEDQKLTLEECYIQFTTNKPVIFSTKNMDISDLKVLNTKAEFLADKIQQVKIDELNECLQFLGINTTPIYKKERLTEDEANSNNDLTSICLSVFLNSRLKAIDEINKKFGLNISLDLADYCRSQFENKKEDVKEDFE